MLSRHKPLVSHCSYPANEVEDIFNIATVLRDQLSFSLRELAYSTMRTNHYTTGSRNRSNKPNAPNIHITISFENLIHWLPSAPSPSSKEILRRHTHQFRSVPDPALFCQHRRPVKKIANHLFVFCRIRFIILA